MVAKVKYPLKDVTNLVNGNLSRRSEVNIDYPRADQVDAAEDGSSTCIRIRGDKPDGEEIQPVNRRETTYYTHKKFGKAIPLNETTHENLDRSLAKPNLKSLRSTDLEGNLSRRSEVNIDYPRADRVDAEDDGSSTSIRIRGDKPDGEEIQPVNRRETTYYTHKKFGKAIPLNETTHENLDRSLAKPNLKSLRSTDLEVAQTPLERDDDSHIFEASDNRNAGNNEAHNGSKNCEGTEVDEKIYSKENNGADLREHNDSNVQYNENAAPNDIANLVGLAPYKKFKPSPSEGRHHACPSCEKAFKSKPELKQHLVSHSEKRPYVCHSCQKAFKSKPDLKQHLARHSENRPYNCHSCEKVFKLKRELKKHLVSHSEKRPHVCPSCEKAFKSKRELKQHLVSHSEKRPHVCPSCEKAFKSKRELKQHLVSHSENRPHVCPSCEKAFKSKPDLKQHLARHSENRPYNCHSCEKVFKLKRELKKHLVSHSEKRPHVCPSCEKAFKSKRELKQHLVSHSEKRLHVCPSCEKAFKSKYNLKKHLISHSGE